MKRPTAGKSAPAAQPSPVRTASTARSAGPVLSSTASPPPQAKLNTSVPGEPLEQEADRVADAVTALAQSAATPPPATPTSGGCSTCGARTGSCKCGKQLLSAGSGVVQRMALPTAPAAPLPIGFGNRLARAASGGGLPTSLRADFEPKFGADLAAVRVHAGAEAARLAGAIGARAFTYGRDIFFGAGQYRPDDRQGRHLVAHELAHVFQQGGPAIKRQAAPGAAPVMTDAEIDEFLAFQDAVERSEEDQGSAVAAAGPGPDLGPPNGIPIAARDHATHWASDAQRLQWINETLPLARFSSAGEREMYLRLSQTLARPKADPFPDFKLGGSAKNAGLPRYVRTINFVVPEFTRPVIVVDQTWTLQTAPDPSAGVNFDTYLYNGTRRHGRVGGQFIPAISLGGTRFRVLMGSAECPGCHFGQGLEVDLYGTHFVVILLMMAGAMFDIALAGGGRPVGLGPMRGPGPKPPLPGGPPNLRGLPSLRSPTTAPPAPPPLVEPPLVEPELGTGTFGPAPARAPAPAPAPVRPPLRIVQPDEVPTPATAPAPAPEFVPAPAPPPGPTAGPIPFTGPLFLGSGSQPAPTPVPAPQPKPQGPGSGCPPGSTIVHWPLPIWVAQGVGDYGARMPFYNRPTTPLLTRVKPRRRNKSLIYQYIKFNNAVFQPLFKKGRRGAIHHKVPLFVSGLDIFDNLVFLTLPLHTLWHRQLAVQGRTGWMIRDPVGTLYCVI